MPAASLPAAFSVDLSVKASLGPALGVHGDRTGTDKSKSGRWLSDVPNLKPRRHREVALFRVPAATKRRSRFTSGARIIPRSSERINLDTVNA